MALLETTVKNGKVQGILSGNPEVSAFLGIPYAKAPAGKLRFRAPEPAEPWEGTRICNDFGYSCWQRDSGKNEAFREMVKDRPVPFRFLRMDEDCLSLNVWTPAETPEEKLPVMVWFYGGGLQGGTSDDTTFDGEGLCGHGVVLVSANYRTGVFGYFAADALEEENEYLACGNYGLLDQVAALRWVHENIGAFGGDPGNVTIFGCSGGGRSCQGLSCTPLTKGLVHHVIIHSAGGLNPNYSTPREKLKELGEKFIRFCGKETVEDLREMPAEELQAYYDEFSKDFDNWFNITDDGYALKYTMDEVVRRGEQQDLDYILSTTKNEIVRPVKEPVTLAEFPGIKFGGRTAIFKEVCDPETDEQANDYVVNAESYEMKSAQLAWARVQAGQDKKPVWLCTFDHPAPGNKYALHGADQMYAFNTLNKQYFEVPEEDEKLSQTEMLYWTNFAKHGDPNGEGLVRWTPFTKDSPLTFVIDVPECGMQLREVPVIEKLTETYINWGR